jgi:hypothetical protein
MREGGGGLIEMQCWTFTGSLKKFLQSLVERAKFSAEIRGINEEKSKHVTFTLRRGICPLLFFNQTSIPQADAVKYLGLYLYRILNWNCYISTLRKHLELGLKNYTGS